MDRADRYAAYAAAFEDAYASDDWSRIAPYFTESATYRSYYGANLEVTGRDAVLRQLRSDAQAFDRKFDGRKLEFTEGPRDDGERIFARWKMVYSKAGAPDLVLCGIERATFEGEQIALLEDEYEPETFGEFGAWLGKYGGFLHED
ncbi:MAG: nuclear transport factor 2 family protein [Myxococcales bacterium]|nr:nuclear transport factor 2 family protein [Myxococcales bacterium]MDH5307925.1 nuclear transport factor 2 family protein [Myxococcales bacterium]MDH5567753.1 nuclear transport factor 2 family protein [Myxococcales bacterium]